MIERPPCERPSDQWRKEVPGEDDTEIVVRVVWVVVVDVHALRIEVPDVDEVAVRAPFAHSRP